MRPMFQPVHRRRSQLLAFFTLALPLIAAPAAFAIGPDNKDQLPRGKEADGIIGDFVLRNDKVKAVIETVITSPNNGGL